MFRYAQSIVAAIALIVAFAIVLAKPPGRQPSPREEAPKPKIHTLPKLDGLATNWGDYQQAGEKQFTLDNHPVWYGVGTLRDDGTVFLLWTLRSTEEACPGVYHVEGNTLSGVWGYGHNTKVEPNGELTGNIYKDRVYPLPTPEPPGL